MLSEIRMIIWCRFGPPQNQKKHYVARLYGVIWRPQVIFGWKLKRKPVWQLKTRRLGCAKCENMWSRCWMTGGALYRQMRLYLRQCRLAYLLHYSPPRYGNEFSIYEAYIQNWVDNFGYLRGYNIGEKGTGALFGKRRADDLRNLCQSGPSTARPTIFSKIDGRKWVFDLDDWWRRIS